MVIIGARADGDVDFDSLIESISQRYPGTRVTDPDYYATRIARQIEICKEQGKAIPNEPLECTIRVSHEHGVQREIDVPIIPGFHLYERLDRLGCLFVPVKDASGSPARDNFTPLIETLTGAGLRADVSWFEDSPPSRQELLTLGAR